MSPTKRTSCIATVDRALLPLSRIFEILSEFTPLDLYGTPLLFLILVIVTAVLLCMQSNGRSPRLDLWLGLPFSLFWLALPGIAKYLWLDALRVLARAWWYGAWLHEGWPLMEAYCLWSTVSFYLTAEALSRLAIRFDRRRRARRSAGISQRLAAGAARA